MGMFAILLLVIVAVLALSVLVLVHEFGHFIIAKKGGVLVEEFGIGFPPRAWGKKLGETIYSVNWLPIGGFVKLHGETGPSEAEASGKSLAHPARAFVNASARLRIAVALAGVIMNFFFAVIAFSLLNFDSGVPSGNEYLGVIETAPNSPATDAGITQDNIILSVDSQKFTDSQEFIGYINSKKGEEISVELRESSLRGSTEKTVRLVPREDPPPGEGSMGVVIAPYNEFYKPVWYKQPFVYTYWGVRETVDITKAILVGFAGIFAEVKQGQAPEGVAGPVGIVAIIAEITRTLGFLSLVRFMAIISINLAVLNMVPFPPLDGFRVLFVLTEKVLGKRRVAKFEDKIVTAGMVVLLFFMLVITLREIPSIFRSGGLSNFVDGIIGG